MTALEKLMADVFSLIESAKTETSDIVGSKVEALSFAMAIKNDAIEATAEVASLTESEKDAYSLQIGYKLFSVLGAEL